MNKKRSVLWRLIRAMFYPLAVFLFILVTLYPLCYDWGNGPSDNQQMTREETQLFNQKRDRLFFIIHAQIGEYYKQNGYYPKSLNDLPITKTDDFFKYRKGITYRSVVMKNKSVYNLELINSWGEVNGKKCYAGKCYNFDFH